MNLINSTSCGITCLSLFPSRRLESRMRKLKMSCGSKWQIWLIWRGFVHHWQCYPVSAALQCWNKLFFLLDSLFLLFLLFGALTLRVICHKVSSPSIFFLATECFMATILQLKVAKRRLFEKVSLERWWQLGTFLAFLEYLINTLAVWLPAILQARVFKPEDEKKLTSSLLMPVDQSHWHACTEQIVKLNIPKRWDSPTWPAITAFNTNGGALNALNFFFIDLALWLLYALLENSPNIMWLINWRTESLRLKITQLTK